MKDTNQQYLDSLTAIQEIRTMNPHMLMAEIYKLLGINSKALNYWVKHVFGMTVSELVKKRIAGVEVKSKKHFHVKHYIMLTEKGMASLLSAIGSFHHFSFGKGESVAPVAYGAVDENNMLCVQLTGNARLGYGGSRLVFTNYAMKDQEHYIVVPHTSPEVLLGIQKRNNGQETY